MSIAVFGSCFSKNIITNLYFVNSTNQLIFAFGLFSSIASGLFLFNLKIGVVIGTVAATLSCVLYYVDQLIVFYVNFFVANVAASILISAAFSLNAQN